MSESLTLKSWRKNNSEIKLLQKEYNDCMLKMGYINKKIHKLVMNGHRMAKMLLNNGESLTQPHDGREDL